MMASAPSALLLLLSLRGILAGGISASFTFLPSSSSCSSSSHRLSPAKHLASSSSSSHGDAATRGEVYGVPGSGWSSPEWNWGYASGTGHDCAMICRRRWSTAESRAALVEALVRPTPVMGGGGGDGDDGVAPMSLADADAARDPPFEEVKLILGLAWQRGRRDGSDGGRGGYGEVLAEMARAETFEPSDDPAKSRDLVEAMRRRYRLLGPDGRDAAEMDAINCADVEGADLDEARRRCAGLVLRAMGFVEAGL